MIRVRTMQALLVGVCLIALCSGIAAAGGKLPVPAPDRPVNHDGGDPSLNEEVRQKQQEIDQYLFVDHAREIAGFQVTHTAPQADYVEIGITPFSVENAAYLYDIFGHDMVLVVAGRQAELLSPATAYNDVEIDAVAQAGVSPAWYALGVFVLIGGFIVLRWKRAIKNTLL
ncbi:MAG TPA: hypothetical protein GXZ96_08115 [Firmicutes bacterium]|jgi:hypothetical protein|nr:hypothetical protein [Bacillota bacterium]